MTYEQAGHGRAGLGILNDEGDVLTLVDRIAHHHTTGLSTVEISSKNAVKINSEFKKYFEAKKFKYQSYVLQGNHTKKQKLMALLDKHEIQYGFANDGTASGFDYHKNASGSMKMTPGDLVVSTNQPKANMVKVLFEPKAKLSDSITYDITAWSIPYAYGFKAIASPKLIAATGNEISSKKVNYEKGDYALAITWDGIASAAYLSEILQNGIRVRFSEKPFENSGSSFARGTLIITKGDNKKLADFTTRLNTINDKHNITTTRITTGFASKGIDIGSPDVKEIKNKKIAVLAGDMTSSLSFGEIQYFLEQELHYPFTAIDADDFSISKLNKYHILILPNGYYGSLLNKKQLNTLKQWVYKGGKVIAIGSACGTFAGQDDFGLKPNQTKGEDAEISDSDKLIAYDQQERESIANYITGAVFKAKVDTTHPLAFGYDNTYFTLKLSSSAYGYLAGGNNVVYLDKANPVSGFAGSETLDNLNKSVVFGEHRMGNGSMIYMVDNPLFRAFWEHGKLFFANALFMSNVNLIEL
jgi:hypothetical protein